MWIFSSFGSALAKTLSKLNFVFLKQHAEKYVFFYSSKNKLKVRSMKLVSFLHENKEQAGLFADGKIYPFHQLDASIGITMKDFLENMDPNMAILKEKEKELKANPSKYTSISADNTKFLAPVPHPTSCRDAYAFRQHVATARRNRGVPMIPEFDQYPVFYFTNHNSVMGPGEVWLMPDHFQKLDFELEASIVIGKRGKNIRAEEADSYIAGYMIMNDLSARTLQMEEMKLNLGPAKGKDFATVIGPWLVTTDELESRRIPTKEGHIGAQYDLEMKAFVNGKQVSEGNLSQMDWTFAELIERASYGVEVHAGDVIGSGTVGTGCFLELNGSGLLKDKNYQVQWLQPDDEIVLEIEMLGSLKNIMKAEDTDYSLLALNKEATIESK